MPISKGPRVLQVDVEVARLRFLQYRSTLRNAGLCSCTPVPRNTFLDISKYSCDIFCRVCAGSLWCVEAAKVSQENGALED